MYVPFYREATFILGTPAPRSRRGFLAQCIAVTDLSTGVYLVMFRCLLSGEQLVKSSAERGRN